MASGSAGHKAQHTARRWVVGALHQAAGPLRCPRPSSVTQCLSDTAADTQGNSAHAASLVETQTQQFTSRASVNSPQPRTQDQPQGQVATLQASLQPCQLLPACCLRQPALFPQRRQPLLLSCRQLLLPQACRAQEQPPPLLQLSPLPPPPAAQSNLLLLLLLLALSHPSQPAAPSWGCFWGWPVSSWPTCPRRAQTLPTGSHAAAQAWRQCQFQ